ncbi:sugar phosphate isomerase/epimerase [Mycetocola tolaasinivorans]|uniref:Sugar phosphate isomerase/epimerase n=1 Tax=Mycetocola tolaasinivorans TaxID=76635 RepID=A0A3L7A5K1_9MICO|nr:sugar phosphate isomerase/epimerase [Mycetocola tolaasinivorans]RLP75589.1 sugar phosphate isomerase/epimerase [Mycetocola tolaasinivorans]
MTLHSLSLQLYSVRNAMDIDPAGTIDRVAEIGLTQVEASYKGLTTYPELLPAIRRNGLISPTMTSPLLDVDHAQVFELAAELGAHTVVETFVPEEHWRTEEDVLSIARRLNIAAERAAAHNLRVGYHNHWWELETTLGEQSAMDLLIANLAPEVVLEIDAYWVAVSGTDVLDFLGRYRDRVRFLHLKDGPISRNNAEQRPAGTGSMPLTEILATVPQIEAGVIEFDEYNGDVFEAIAESFAFLSPKVGA